MSLLRLAHNSVDSNKVGFTARRAETAMGAFQQRRGDTGADVGLAVVYLALRSSGPASSELVPTSTGAPRTTSEQQLVNTAETRSRPVFSLLGFVVL